MKTNDLNSFQDIPHGFSGISSLVTTLPCVPHPAPAQRSEPIAARLELTERRPVANDAARRPPTTGSPFWTPGKALVGLGGIVLVWMLIASQGNPTYQPQPPRAPSSTYTQPPAAYPPPPVTYSPPPPAAPALREALPQAGTGLVLNASEIYYCLSQGARLDAMKKMVDTTSSTHIRNFNSLVADFNPRCSNYKYRQSDFQTAKRVMEARLSQIEAEAASAVRTWR